MKWIKKREELSAHSGYTYVYYSGDYRIVRKNYGWKLERKREVSWELLRQGTTLKLMQQFAELHNKGELL